MALTDFIQEVADSLDVTPKIEMLPMQPEDVHITYADISKAQEKLEYYPKIPIHEGISRFASWYKNYCAT